MTRVLKRVVPSEVEAICVGNFGKDYHDYQIRQISNDRPLTEIRFQSGPIKQNGVNGCQNEDLLLVLIDRLQGFQKGEFSSKENACALTHLQEALMWLERRTLERQSRGVEGTNVK